MNRFFKWARSFSGIVMILGIIAALVIAFGPLIRESIARRTWLEVPCEINADASRYHFMFNGQRYYSARINFWQMRAWSAEHAAGVDPIDPNGVCYISGTMPPSAVLRLDAHNHLEQGMGFFAGAGLILIVSAFLAFSGKRVQGSRAS